MDPIHATIEEFAAEGYTHIALPLSAMSSDENAADVLVAEKSRWG